MSTSGPLVGWFFRSRAVNRPCNSFAMPLAMPCCSVGTRATRPLSRPLKVSRLGRRLALGSSAGLGGCWGGWLWVGGVPVLPFVTSISGGLLGAFSPRGMAGVASVAAWGLAVGLAEALAGGSWQWAWRWVGLAVARAVGLAVGSAAENLLRPAPRCPYISHTHCGRATGCARLQPVWLDRVFRELSNARVFVGFGWVFVDFTLG